MISKLKVKFGMCGNHDNNMEGESACGLIVSAVAHHFFHVFLSPFGQLVNQGNERFAGVGKGIFDLWWHLGIDLTVDKAVGFEVFQRTGEYTRRYVGYEATEFVETDGAFTVDYAEYEQ